jgi:glycosyltransferase involved in cell wall biosynthesis
MDKRVTVVIPCRNEEQYIKRCVDSILNQDYPNLELLVVDGMSDDRTMEVLQQYRDDKRFKVVENPKRVTPIALNLGI